MVGTVQASGVATDDDTSTPDAVNALEDAQEAVSTKTPEDAQDQLADDSGQDATMALTSLWRQRGELNESDKAQAAKVLARPSASKRICNTAQKVCVHYGSSTTTAWAKKTLAVVAHVSKTYVKAGYRRPVGDGSTGGKTNYMDVYLKDVASQGYYGYCVPDQQKAGPKGSHVATAYCVLDNDYSSTQYPSNTPLQNLKVTAAHEYFHSVQFAYDYNEDTWLMEGTAVWAEDQLYTNINDNLQYLPYGQLKRPRTSLDKTTTFGVYGNWIFFRYLTEHFKSKKGSLPSLILGIWRRADSSRGSSHDQYSVQAISKTLAARGSSLKKMYAAFTEANHHPKVSYREGKANNYPIARITGQTKLSKSKKKASGSFKVAHLASASERVNRGSLSGGWSLKVRVKLAKPTVSVAKVTVYRAGHPHVRSVKLNKHGAGSVVVGFGASVTKVEITLVNTGHGFKKCGNDTAYACGGKPTTGHLKEAWSTKLVRS
ncbi:MAG: hypothetical protein QM638_10200 [Nocardioides sp.]|uniref:MXAN_6640 family putative metalloprotease n=1 Tax=Nocardioides sp. TaxID=35761 RepID=UPI0039E540C0